MLKKKRFVHLTFFFKINPYRPIAAVTLTLVGSSLLLDLRWRFPLPEVQLLAFSKGFPASVTAVCSLPSPFLTVLNYRSGLAHRACRRGPLVPGSEEKNLR